MSRRKPENWDSVDVNDFVRRHPDGASIAEIANEVGIRRESVREVLQRALESFVRNAEKLGLELSAPNEPEAQFFPTDHKSYQCEWDDDGLDWGAPWSEPYASLWRDTERSPREKLRDRIMAEASEARRRLCDAERELAAINAEWRARSESGRRCEEGLFVRRRRAEVRKRLKRHLSDYRALLRRAELLVIDGGSDE